MKRRIVSIFLIFCLITILLPGCVFVSRDFRMTRDSILDEIGNVLIRKPATKGKENSTPVLLQSHMDMVCEKNNDKVHDFNKDPIEAHIEGEWVKANGTTLGSDNGMGVAAAMAVLKADNIAHGPVEALFTVDEETGMTGAFGIKPGLMDGDILIRINSDFLKLQNS